jgi:hypothetical protein
MNEYQMLNPEAFTEEYEEEQRILAEMAKYPSFKALTGHAPVSGKDYNPNGDMCQDDYEYFTGTGRYSDIGQAEVPFPDDEPDESMDGDHQSALASCGWGTDEDYGYYGEGDDF